MNQIFVLFTKVGPAPSHHITRILKTSTKP
jgi:hypothetical protein